jgi:hypothetical protein
MIGLALYVLGGLVGLAGVNLLIIRHDRRVGRPLRRWRIRLAPPFGGFNREEWLIFAGVVLVSLGVMVLGAVISPRLMAPYQ